MVLIFVNGRLMKLLKGSLVINMKTFEIKVEKTLRLTEEDINDILCSCFEGGCGYWACLDNGEISWEIARVELYKNGNADPTMEDIMTWILSNGRSIFIEDEEDDNERYSFDMNDFFEGINLAVREGFWDGDDIGDIDGWVGDAIIQYAVFGEQVYG